MMKGSQKSSSIVHGKLEPFDNMKKLLSIIAMVSFCFIALGQLGPTNKPARVMVMWDPNPETDIAGYKIYHGTNSRNYSVVIPVLNIVSNGLTVAHATNLICSNFLRGVTYHFAATAYNTLNLESDFSEEAVLHITDKPGAPGGLTLTNVAGVVTIHATLRRAPELGGPWETAAVVAPYYEEPDGQAFFKMIMGIDLFGPLPSAPKQEVAPESDPSGGG